MKLMKEDIKHDLTEQSPILTFINKLRIFIK